MLIDRRSVELIGWAARVWASQCPYNSTAFTIQISLLVVGKTMLLAFHE